MIRQLFHSRKVFRQARPTVRPTLESLEAREVPTSVQAAVSAAFQELPGAMNGLGLSIAQNNPNNGNPQVVIIQNDINTLANNASQFAQPSRQQIDVALFTNGFQLIQDGLGLAPIAPNTAAGIQNLGVTAIVSGYIDYIEANSGISNGNLQLS